MASEEELIRARRAKFEKLEQAGTQAFPNTFSGDEASRKAALAMALADEAVRSVLPTEAELQGHEPSYQLFGRVVAKRGPFVVVRTPYGDMQALVRKDKLAATEAAQLAALDLSDFVAVSGPLIRTGTGAAAVRAEHYQHVGKALLPPPDKWHGLTDVEKRYRERYVDLFSTPEISQVFRARSLILKSLRSFLDSRDFLEVETPILQSVRGGATAKPFNTHHNALDLDFYLRIAPELYLKRLLVGGLERVYELGRVFRNEGVSARHNPEFTILEFYQAYADCDALITLTEELLVSVDQAVRTAFPVFGEARSFSLARPFARVGMRDSIADRVARSGQDELGATPFDGALTRDVVRDPARLSALISERNDSLPKELRVLLGKCSSHGERIYVLYEQLVEPDLTKLYRSADGSQSVPVFITEYPFEVSPLARRNDHDPAFVDRFELFIEGRELANAFSELNDPEDQAERFRAQLDNRTRGDDEAMDFDADYIRALSYGMPPAAGFGLGLDRLVMALCNQASIRDVLLFPAMRPELR
ncbi:MAG: Lysyl-tRNA synthetase [Myxococcaceae bacterium]|nr:Lysyl-tRNA synthetase [Myxococcaceae bacterium]